MKKYNFNHILNFIFKQRVQLQIPFFSHPFGKGWILFLLSITPLLSCTTTTSEGEVGVHRRQLLLIPSDEVIGMATESYSKTLQDARRQGKLDVHENQVKRVSQITKKIIPQTSIFRSEAPGWDWQVHVITSPEINAYCMPGGKIAFYTGIIEKLNLTDGEIAAIAGHEIAHALREHGRERMSEEMIKNISLQTLIASGKLDEKNAQYVDMISSLLVTLPHSRGQESEADEIGLELMARAGYNPEEALSLWQKMAQFGGGKPPEILSTHPTDAKRLDDIKSLLPKVLPLYNH